MGEIEIQDPIGLLAKKKFKLDYLFPFQRLVISNILETAYIKDLIIENEDTANIRNILDLINSGEISGDSDCRPHQMAVLPTGAGKSLCFMLPVFFLDGITLVIFPLLGLIADQRRRCLEAGIAAEKITGDMDSTAKKEVFGKIENGECRMVLTNPESLASPKVQKILTKRIVHIVIDEAHTVSQWGDTFRPAYLKLREILPLLEAPIITAFTATASSHICKRIGEVIFPDKNMHLVNQLPDRPNIHYSVRYPLDKDRELVKIINEENVLPLIIFCSSRTGVEILTQKLREKLNRDNIYFYHAGLSPAEKKKIEEWFFNSNDGILAATCAYGMGVDKSNIRCVVHYDIPTTIEAYLQEAGRGGRDRQPAKAVALIGPGDNGQSPLIPLMKSRDKCRRNAYLSMLGEEADYCPGCDICENDQYQPDNIDVQFAKFIRKHSGRFSVDEIASLMSGCAYCLDGYKTALAPSYCRLLYPMGKHEIGNFIKTLSGGSILLIPKSGPWANRVVYPNVFHRFIDNAFLVKDKILKRPAEIFKSKIKLLWVRISKNISRLNPNP